MNRGKTLKLKTDISALKDNVHLLLTVSCCFRTKPFLLLFLYLSCVCVVHSVLPLAGGKLFFYWISSILCSETSDWGRCQNFSWIMEERKIKLFWDWVAMEIRIFKLCKYCMEQIWSISKDHMSHFWANMFYQTLEKEMFVNLLFVPNRSFVMLMLSILFLKF